MTRFLFATDLHGNSSAYSELFQQAVAHGARAIVLGGDVTTLPPRGADDLLGPQRRWIESFMAPAFRAFHRDHPDIPIFTMLGNDDWACNLDLFQALEAGGACRLLHGRAQPFLDGLHIAGYGCVPVTPFFMKDLDRLDRDGWEPSRHPRRCLVSDGGAVHEVPYDVIRSRPTIADDLERLAAHSDPARTVYVFHTPPADTKCDLMFDGVHIGSGAARDFLERRQPPLSLHGHIHESPEKSGSVSDRIGRTLVVNPGASLHYLQAALLDLEDPQGSLQIV